jgi:signal transduction histidine kinase
MRRSRLEEKLVRSERSASAGRTALTIAHDAGKELAWMKRLLERLPRRRRDNFRFERDVEMLMDFTEGIVQQMRSFVADSIDSASDEPGFVPCADLIERAARKIERIHRHVAIDLVIDPGVRKARCHEHTSNVLTNLVDNAVRASDVGSPVHVYATREAAFLRLEVIDQGHGMTGRQLASAFRLGFTTRGAEGGLGVGLNVSKDIIEALGGSLELDTDSGVGTRAVVRVPIVTATDSEGTNPALRSTAT